MDLAVLFVKALLEISCFFNHVKFLVCQVELLYRFERSLVIGAFYQ
jgi:hypothetical protein